MILFCITGDVMHITTYINEKNFDDIKSQIIHEDAMFFRKRAPGERMSDWRYNRDSNPLDYLSADKNQVLCVLTGDNDKFCGYARLSFDETNKTCFDVSLRASLDFVYVAPSQRGSGVSKHLMDAIISTVSDKITKISDIFPIKRKLSLTLYSLPVSPGGLAFSKKFMESEKLDLSKRKFKFVDIQNVDFHLDMSEAKFNSGKPVMGAAYGV